MEFPYPNSHLANPSATDPDHDLTTTASSLLCDASIPVRIHNNAALADRRALRAQKDWQRVFGGLPPGFGGIMGPQHNFVSTIMPETLPDRLEMVGYVVEMALILDDMIDSAGGESTFAAAAPYMAELLQAYNMVMGGEWERVGEASPLTRMVVDFERAMVEIDGDGARGAFRWLERWVRLMMKGAVDGGGDKGPGSFEEYLGYRRVNVASQATMGLFLFAMGLDIPEDQQQTCLELTESFSLQGSLVNDYYSWEREKKAATDHDQPSVTNAIWVLMNKHSMTCEEAKAVCCDKAKGYATQYLQVIEAARDRDDLCRDAKVLLDVLKFGMSGNIVWSLQSPRYHADRELNPAQKAMAKAVRADETLGWNHVEQKPADGTAKQAKDETTNGPVNDTTHKTTVAVRDVPTLTTEIIDAPSRYLDSLPGKGIRDQAIDMLNTWYQVSADDAAVVKRVINLLHGASLMLDDIQDSSQLRRGKPATHIVFGSMQTINSAGYRFLDALIEVRKLDSERCMDIFCEEIRSLYIGQSHDLAWTCNLNCPTEEEYLAMVDGKTAGLFRLLARLLDAKSNSSAKPDVAALSRFMTLLGRLFQIRDDLMNLTSADYTKQKGFCEDLNEGKYSLPLLHALGQCRGTSLEPATNKTSDSTVLRNLLSQRHVAGRMTVDQKKLFLEYLKSQGSLEYTRHSLNALQSVLKGMAEQMGMLKDEKLRMLLELLKV